MKKNHQQQSPRQTGTKPQRLRIDNLLTFDPLTEGQASVYEAWDDGQHIVMAGTAGTGKTFTAMYLSLEQVLDKGVPGLDKVVIVRSIVPTKEIGFLPGSIEEKIEPYIAPYKAICTQLFDDPEAYTKLSDNNSIEFISTSFIRGVTISNAVVIVDEMQNLSFHELDSIITRLGDNCRVIFCGDYHQSDLTKNHERNGILKFLEIIDHMNKFEVVTFTWADIVRSDFVRDYIMTKEYLGVTNE